VFFKIVAEADQAKNRGKVQLLFYNGNTPQFTFLLHGVHSWTDQSEVLGGCSGCLTVKAQPPGKLTDNLYAIVPAQSELCAEVLVSESLW